MQAGARPIPLPNLFGLAAGVLACCLTACSDAHAGAGAAPGAALTIADEPLAPYRSELLELAFKTAAAFPLQPYAKNRSRAEDAVVQACLALDQPRRALGYVEQIPDWRRGLGYAAFSRYCAEHGHGTEVEPYLELARDVVRKRLGEEDAQAWETDRIQVEIAKTRLLLGQADQATALEAGLVESETGKVDALRASRSEADGFDAILARAEERISTGQHDLVKNALETCAKLFERFYGDADLRSRAEEKIKASWSREPLMTRLELLLELARCAVEHADPPKALALIDEAHAIQESARWNPEDQVQLMSRLAELRSRAGDLEGARREAIAALMTYNLQRDKIETMFRAGTLRPLAEAYQSMGDTATALSLYRRVVEAGAEHPSSRPRADDLSATCCSMAVRGVEPDDALRARMTGIFDGLGASW